ncbi:MAG: hypothetical protein WC475_02750 [Candidatus Paceibacterota bacterium]
MTTAEKIKPGIFKANDIRGRYPSEINEKIISEIVKKLSGFSNSGKIVVAHDARLSSSGLYKVVVSQLKTQNSKLKAIEAGLATTPMFYFLVKKLKAAGGIMITASHNPKNYNGLKIVDKNALPISGLEVKKMFDL